MCCLSMRCYGDVACLCVVMEISSLGVLSWGCCSLAMSGLCVVMGVLSLCVLLWRFVSTCVVVEVLSMYCYGGVESLCLS